MKREYIVTICIGLVGAMACLLFPYWHTLEVSSEARVVYRDGYSLYNKPTGPDATIDYASTWSPYCGAALLTIAALYAFRATKSDKEAAVYWKQKWAHVGDAGNTLLRAASDDVHRSSDSLLRGTGASAAATPIQMLRASDEPAPRAQEHDGSAATDTGPVQEQDEEECVSAVEVAFADIAMRRTISPDEELARWKKQKANLH